MPRGEPARWCGCVARAAAGSASSAWCATGSGDRPHLYYQLRVHRRRAGEPKDFTWADYRDLIIAAHRQLGAPVVWNWEPQHPPRPAARRVHHREQHVAAGLPAARLTRPQPRRGHLVAAQAAHRQLRRRRRARPGPHHQAQAQEDPVPAPPDQRLPRRHRPDNRTLVTSCTTSSIWLISNGYEAVRRFPATGCDHTVNARPVDG